MKNPIKLVSSILFLSLLTACGEPVTKEVTIEVPHLLNKPNDIGKVEDKK